LLAALAAVLALGSWQTLTVRYNYGGNWTALFQMGDLSPLPEELKQGAYFWRSHKGYEGEEARVVAHDPLNAKGWSRYLDDAEMRYMRWLMPAMAHAAGLGRREWIDAAYVGVFLLFAGLGTYSLALEYGQRGAVFVLLPATLISMDRLTVNVSLAALAAAALVARRRGARAWFWLAVALGPVAHPQGWVFPAAALMTGVRWKQWRQVGLAAACMVPGWLTLAAAQRAAGGGRMPIEAVLDWVTPLNIAASIGAGRETLATRVAAGGSPLLAIMRWWDEATLLTLAAVCVWTVWRFRLRSGRWERWVALFLVLPGALIDVEHHLTEPFTWLNYGTPLLLMHWADTPRHLRLARWGPVAICGLRAVYQFGFQVLGVLRGLLA
jgi:hypothetical protein